MATWLIVLIVYLVGAAVTGLIVRKWENPLNVKIAAAAVWPGVLILYIIHKIHMRL